MLSAKMLGHITIDDFFYFHIFSDSSKLCIMRITSIMREKFLLKKAWHIFYDLFKILNSGGRKQGISFVKVL